MKCCCSDWMQEVAAQQRGLHCLWPQEQAKAQLQQTVSRLTDECWEKCVGNPGSYLSGREQSCLDNCARRFLETTQFVVK